MSWRLRLGELFERRVGIRLQVVDFAKIATHIEQRFDAPADEHFESYFRRLGADVESAELPPGFGDLVQVVINGQTCFRRDPSAIQAVVHGIRGVSTGRARVWSVGCSSGEEPYSLAMECAAQMLPVSIVASDLSERNLKAARLGVYDEWRLRRLPNNEVQAHFSYTVDGRLRMADAIQRRVTFVQHNLVASPPLSCDEGWDVILCQNVFIYYSEQTIVEAVSRFVSVLREGGLLILGASEKVPEAALPLEPVSIDGRLAYRKTAHVNPASGVVRRVASLLETSERTFRPNQIEDRPRAEEPESSSDVPPQSTRAFERAPEGVYRALGQASIADEPLRNSQVVSKTSFDGGEAAEATCERLCREGAQALQAHDLEVAVDCFRQAEEANPRSPEPPYRLGIVAFKRQRFADAERDLRRALFHDASFWPAAYHLATIYERAGDAEGARRALRRALAGLAEGSADRLRLVGSPSRDWIENACRVRLDRLKKRSWK